MDEQRLAQLIADLDDYESNTRYFAARELGELGDPRAFAALVPLLNDEGAGVKRETMQALLRIDRAAATELLMRRLYEGDTEARSHLIYYLNALDEELFDPVLVPQLAELMIAELRNESCITRSHAAQLLGSLAYPPAFDALTAALTDEEDGLRQDAAIALGRLGNARAFDALLAALDAEEGQEFASTEDIAAALRKLGGTRAFDLRSASLLAKLEDADPQVREYAAAALRGFADPRALEALAGHAADAEDWVRIHANAGLAAMGEAGMLKLLELTIAEDKDVRERALAFVGEFNDARAISSLLKAADDPEMQAVATDALAKIVPQQAIELITQRIASSSGEEQIGWLERLNYIGDYVIGYEKLTAAVDTLLPLLDNEDTELQDKVARLLGQIYDPRAFPALLRLLESDDAKLRNTALLGLRGKGTPLTFDKVAALLNDNDSHVRSQAAAALGDLGDKRAVDLLIPMPTDADEWTRSYTVDALGLLRDGRAVPALLPLLQDESGDVRFFTVRALAMIGDPAVLPALREMLNDDGESYWRPMSTVQGEAGRAIRHLERKLQRNTED